MNVHFPATAREPRRNATALRRGAAIAVVLSSLSAATFATSNPRAAAATRRAGFTVTASSPTLTIAPGSTESVTVRASRSAGFTSPVYIGVVGLPKGVTVKSSVNPLRSSGSSSELRLTAAATVRPTSFTLSIRGSSKGQTSSTIVRVTVGSPAPVSTSPATTAAVTTTAPATTGPAATSTLAPTTTRPNTTTAPATTTTSPFRDYTLSVEPTTVTLFTGGTSTATLRVTRTGGFNEALLASLENLPTGVTGSVDAVDVNASTSQIRLSATPGATLGLSDVVVRARGRSATFKVNVSPLALTIAPTALTIARGSTGSTTVSINRPPSTSTVNWSTESPNAGITAAFSPTGTTATSSTMTVTVASSVAAGTYTLIARASTDGGAVSNTFTVTVTEGSGATVSPTAAVLAPGGSTNIALTLPIAPLAGSSVSLSTSGPAGVTGVLGATSATTVNITLAVASSAAAGASTVTFTVSYDGRTVTGTLTLTVSSSGVTTTSTTLPAQFVLSLSSPSLTIARNASGATSILVAWNGGATQSPITFSVSGLPTGILTPTFTTNPSAIGTTVTIGPIPPGTSPGTYSVSIIGTVGATATSTPLSLIIT